MQARAWLQSSKTTPPRASPSCACCVLVGLLLALWLAATPSWAQTSAAEKHAAALQSCPTVSKEIVDLDMLAKGLEHSSAVGLFEKLRLKSAIDNLLDRFKDYHRGTGGFTLDQLQEQYDVLMMRIASQLQDKDASLHGQLCNAWDSIWATLEDRKTFREKLS
jgi:hypothetical protein